ncbi:MAG: DNA-binding protein [Bacteroidales bacterium]|nr:DNA-binding protein [Bacteroidales bacterium]
MSIKYKLIAKRNPRDLEAPAKFYASSIKTRKIDIDELSQAIARSSTVARADVYAVLVSLIDEAVVMLSNGNQLELGKLGSLGINLQSEGAETEELFSQAHIKGAKVIYRPGAELKAMISALKFEKA